jgi:amidase
MMTSTDTRLWALDAHDTATLIRLGRISAVEATRAALDRLHAVNPQINAITLALDDEALRTAQACDAARARGEALGILHGVPVTTKCNVDQAGLPTDNGAPAFKDLIAKEDSPVVANLKRAGAVIIGRTNTPAFSMRGHTDNALHGATLNPWDRRATPGGSSGGAGAATASGIGAIGHGNDIGGSIRWPAYCNGVYGLRPSYGRVSRINGSAPPGRPMSSQLMAVDGPLARSVRDIRLGLQAMAARDPRDNRWTPVPLRLEPVRRPMKVALVTRSDGPSVQQSCWDAVRTVGKRLQAAGYHVEEVSPPDLHAVSELWHGIGTTEQAHLLAPRLQGSGDPSISTFLEYWWQLRKPRDMAGYMSAFIERDTLLHRWLMFFEDWPIVVMPSSTEPPVPAGIDIQGLDGCRRMLDALYFQLTLPVLGLPGLAVPVGMAQGLPMGVQLTAARYREDLLLDAAEVLEAHEGPRTPIDPIG